MIRRILTKEEAGKKRKRNQLLIGMILILVMLLSTIGYSFMQEERTDNGTNQGNVIDYNGFKFVNQSDFWFLTIDNKQYVFRYNPSQVEELKSSFATNIKKLDGYTDKPLYVYSENKEAEIEIYRNFQGSAMRIQPACIEGKKCEENVPIKDCQNNFIIIEKAEISSIKQDKNCVIIQGSEENLTKITDEFIFKVLEIV